MVDPVSGVGGLPPEIRPLSGEELLARAAHEARHLEHQARAEAEADRPPEPAFAVPTAWPLPVPAEDLGSQIDLLA